MSTFQLLQAPLDITRQLADVINDMTEDEKRNILQILKNSMNNEKRHRHRKHQFIKTQVVSDSRSEIGIIENLSPSGAFLTTRHLSPPGSEIILSFSILNFEFPVRLKAEVVWIARHGMGLRFKTSQKLAYRLAAQKLADALGPVQPVS